MKLTLANALLLISMFGITGCNKPMDLNELLEHPLVVKKEADKCLQTQSQSDYCKTVMIAANKLMSVMTEQQNDPEAFGQTILNLEVDYGKAKTALSQLQSQSATKDDIDRAKAKVNTLGEEIRMRLAVAGLNSPE